jgi:hypothetical protein
MTPARPELTAHERIAAFAVTSRMELSDEPGPDPKREPRPTPRRQVQVTRRQQRGRLRSPRVRAAPARCGGLCPRLRGRLVVVDVALWSEADLDVDADQQVAAAVGVGVADRDDVEHLGQPRRGLLALLGVPSNRIFTAGLPGTVLL